MNKITVYEGNTEVVTCAVTNSDGTDAVLAGFTAYLTVKTDKETSTVAEFTSTGTIVGNDITFTITEDDNSIQSGTYYYEVSIHSTTEDFTLVQDRYIVKKSMTYVT
jgi:hypothetical protein